VIFLNYGYSFRDHTHHLPRFLILSLDMLTNKSITIMNRTIAIIIFALSLSFTENTLAGEVMKLYENDSGKTVEIIVGDEVEFILPSNPTTGYVWEASSLDTKALALDKSDYVASANTIGTGGMEVRKFHATAEGSSEVRFIYHRPFERNVPPLKTFSATVVIKK